MKYATIRTHEPEFAVCMMCRALAVSRSGYYDWRGRAPSLRAQLRTQLDGRVRQAFEAEKSRIGSPRVSRRLKMQGHIAGHNQVAQSMNRQGLRAKGARKFKATTNSNHSLPVAENLLKQDFTAERPNQKWVSDITYIATDAGWL